jgi:catechol 2,3-dioxygenase-like lactoylglutathione lyase family enzyme
MTEAYEYPVVHLELRTGNLPRACAFYAELLGWGPGAGRHRGGFLPGASDGGLGPAGWRSVVASPAGGEIALWQPKSQAIDRDPARPRTSTTEGNAR